MYNVNVLILASLNTICQCYYFHAGFRKAFFISEIKNPEYLEMTLINCTLFFKIACFNYSVIKVPFCKGN